MIRSRDFINSVHWYVWALLLGLSFLACVGVAGVVYHRMRVRTLPPGKQQTDRLAALLSWVNAGLSIYLVYLVWHLVPGMLRTQSEVSIPPHKLLLWAMWLAFEGRAPTFFASLPYLMLSGSVSVLFFAMTDASVPTQRKLVKVAAVGVVVQTLIIGAILIVLFKTELLLYKLLSH